MNKKQNDHFVVSQENWSLHRKGYQDQQRHMDKVKEAIQNNLPDLISEESIIMSNGQDVIKIPIRSLDEYKIRYNHDKSKHVGQGDGDSQVGDVVASDGEQGKSGPGQGKQAGINPGKIIMKQKSRLQKLRKRLFKELELPIWNKKNKLKLQLKKLSLMIFEKKDLSEILIKNEQF